jgi:hypothetical protein
MAYLKPPKTGIACLRYRAIPGSILATPYDIPRVLVRSKCMSDYNLNPILFNLNALKKRKNEIVAHKKAKLNNSLEHQKLAVSINHHKEEAQNESQEEG